MKKLMFTLMTAVSFAAVAQEAPHRGPRGMMGAEMKSDMAVMAVMNPKVAEKAGIPEDIRKQIKDLDTASKAKLRELQDKVRPAMEKQATLMKAEKIDEKAVMAAIDELFEVRKDMAKEQTKRIIAMKALITPEQLTKVTDVMKEMREERFNKRKTMGPKPEGKCGPKPECKDCPKPECDKPVPPPPAE